MKIIEAMKLCKDLARSGGDSTYHHGPMEAAA